MKSSDRYLVDGVLCHLDGHGLPVANLSVGGLFAATDRPPLPGQVVALELSIGEESRYPVTGLVTWVNGPDKVKAPHLPLGFGIKITRIGMPAKLAILNVLKRATFPRRP